MIRMIVAILASGLFAASAGLPGEGPRRDEPKASARLEARACADCMTVRFLIRNEGDVPLEIIYGRGGPSLLPRFRIGEVEITPTSYSRPVGRAMKPEVLTIPPGGEAIYGSYVLASPHGPGFVPEEQKVISGVLDYNLKGRPEPRFRLAAGPIRWPEPRPHQEQ